MMCRLAFRALLLLIGLIGLTTPCVHASGLIHADGHYFKDEQGRVVLLRGVDIGNTAKTPPFDPLTHLDQLQWLHDLGINNIRLYFIWEAFEAEKGKFDYSYLEKLGRLVSEAGRLGISTVVDFHSDAFSRFLMQGCGSGYPKWVLPPDVTPVKPQNDTECSGWALNAARESFDKNSDFRKVIDAFYSDRYGARTEYLKTFSEIAKYFSKFPTVVGYDILNEPWGDEQTQIAPLYEDAAKVIRAEDPHAVLFVEPTAFAAVGLTVGTKLPKPSFDNFAFSGHNYDLIGLGTQVYLDDALLLDEGFRGIQDVTSRWNIPIYVGEYGGQPTGLQMEYLIDHYYHLYDRNFISAAQCDFNPAWNPVSKDGWDREDLSIVDPSGKPRNNFKVRPFAMAVSGLPIFMDVNLTLLLSDRALTFSWTNDPTLGTTDFFVPHDLLNARSEVNFSSPNPDLRCHYNDDTWILSCSSATPGRKDIRILSALSSLGSKTTPVHVGSGTPLILSPNSPLNVAYDVTSKSWLFDASHSGDSSGWGSPLQLETLSDGNFRIPLAKNVCLDLPAGNPASGITFNPHACGTSGSALNQEFKKIQVTNGFLLQIALTGKCLAWRPNGAGIPLFQFSCDPQDTREVFAR